MYSTQTLQKAVEKLALQNLLLLDQISELEKKVDFYRAMTFPRGDDLHDEKAREKVNSFENPF